MNCFEFSSVKLLRILPDDNPNLTINDGNLTITATREGSTIMIQAPINSLTQIGKLQSKVVEKNSAIPEKGKRRVDIQNIKRGSGHHAARLTETQVMQIKERYSSKIYMKQFNSKIAAISQIAKEYNVSPTCIRNITGGRTWKHVTLTSVAPMPEYAGYNK